MLNKYNIDKNILTLVTQVVVDKEDKAFQHPTKPIGLYYTDEQKDSIQQKSFLHLSL